jgi:hypothetical protein
MATERGGRIISDQESETVRRILKLFSELTTYRNVYAGQWEEAAILVLPTSRKPAPDPEMPASAFQPHPGPARSARHESILRQRGASGHPPQPATPQMAANQQQAPASVCPRLPQALKRKQSRGEGAVIIDGVRHSPFPAKTAGHQRIQTSRHDRAPPVRQQDRVEEGMSNFRAAADFRGRHGGFLKSFQ